MSKCRLCSWWKRRTPDRGTCWHPEQIPHGQTVTPDHGCERYAPKVERTDK